ncbi:hypothetical protein MAR_034325 [Mya arenaria]|uniref:Uncharacterized protein n=1 Tax=Mya arenaria TaxID=6604 RepID=A0ABY7GBK8_MYAAR|nr:hypothetical protein MAR_034325 [Mya arenaria]
MMMIHLIGKKSSTSLESCDRGIRWRVTERKLRLLFSIYNKTLSNLYSCMYVSALFQYKSTAITLDVFALDFNPMNFQ